MQAPTVRRGRDDAIQIAVTGAFFIAIWIGIATIYFIAAVWPSV